MKTINDIISEANEAKDKNIKELKVGDTIYYVSPFSKTRKIESGKIIKKYWHDSMTISGYTFPQSYEFEIHLNSQNKDIRFIVDEYKWNTKIYVDCGLNKDGSYYGAYATDRTLLDEYQEKLVDSDIKELQDKIDKFNKDYEKKKSDLEEQYNELVTKKLEKYDD